MKLSVQGSPQADIEAGWAWFGRSFVSPNSFPHQSSTNCEGIGGPGENIAVLGKLGTGGVLVSLEREGFHCGTSRGRVVTESSSY